MAKATTDEEQRNIQADKLTDLYASWNKEASANETRIETPVETATEQEENEEESGWNLGFKNRPQTRSQTRMENIENWKKIITNPCFSLTVYI